MDIIIDTDPGVDDFMCIALALAQRKTLNILGLTIVHGNLGGQTGLQQLGRNARAICRLAGRQEIKVVLGEYKPLTRDVHEGAPFV
jgi:inosine-uridine nucleoside N-ribohydrolase